MAKLLSTKELATHIDNFREILTHFDYSSIQNIRFFNLESLYSYMDTVKDNPFSKQYQALEDELDYIQPYLPFTSNDRATEFLSKIAKAKDDEEVAAIKKDYTKKLRHDFINLARTLTTPIQWQDVIDSCEQIRCHKEELCLASY